MLPVRCNLLITTLCFSLQACSSSSAVPASRLTAVNTAEQMQVQLLLQTPERQPAANVVVSLSSTHTEIQRLHSNAQGEVLLKALDPHQPYLLSIEHPGFLPLKRQLDLRELPPESGLKLVLSRWVQRLSGQVTDAQGQPLAEVNLQAGNAVTVSDADGQFVLYTTERANTLQAFRQGYTQATATLTDVQSEALRLLLPPANPQRRLRLDDAWQPLGLANAAQKSAWREALSDAEAKGYSLLPWEAETLDPERDMLWLRSPAQAIDETRQQEIEDFVLAGGKLWVNTEWAGFGGFHQASIQRLLARFGLAPGGDSLRTAAGSTELVIRDFTPHYLTTGLNSLHLAHAGSVGLYQPAQGALLAWTPGDTFRILQQQAAPQGMMAVQYAGLGKVGVLSDTSLWLSTNGAYTQADHRALWLRCLAW